MFFSHQQEVQYSEMITTLQRFQGKPAENIGHFCARQILRCDIFAVINLRETLPDFTAYIFIKERDLKDLKIAFLEIVLEICQFLTDFGFVLTHLLYLRFFFFFFKCIFNLSQPEDQRVWKTTFFLSLLVIMLGVQSESHCVLSSVGQVTSSKK